MIRYPEFVLIEYISYLVLQDDILGQIGKRVRSVNSGWYFPQRTQQFIMRYILHYTPVNWPRGLYLYSLFLILSYFKNWIFIIYYPNFVSHYVYWACICMFFRRKKQKLPIHSNLTKIYLCNQAQKFRTVDFDGRLRKHKFFLFKYCLN